MMGDACRHDDGRPLLLIFVPNDADEYRHAHVTATQSMLIGWIAAYVEMRSDLREAYMAYLYLMMKRGRS